MRYRDEEIGDLLRGSPVPPSTLTAERALMLGRRSVRRRRTAALSAAVVVVLGTAGVVSLGLNRSRQVQIAVSPSAAVSPSPSTPAVCRPEKLGTGQVSAVDPTGRYIAGGGRRTAGLWTDGKHTAIKVPSDVDEVMVGGVNSSGTVVGQAHTRDGKSYAFKYADGEFTRLPGTDKNLRAAGINSRGDIVGNSDRYAYLWPASAPGAPRRLEAPAKLQYGPTVYGIGDDGMIVGTLDDGGHPYYWTPDGKGHIAAETAGQPGGKIFAIGGEWGAGWVSGPGGLAAARWNLHTGELTVYPGVGAAEGVSDAGDVIAQAGSLGGAMVHIVAGKVSTLPGAGASWPVGISADGRTIVGSAGDQVIRWRC